MYYDYATTTGERNQHLVVRIDKTALKNYAQSDFRKFFAYVVAQKHVKVLKTTKDMSKDAQLSHVVYGNLKTFLKHIIGRFTCPKKAVFLAVLFKRFFFFADSRRKKGFQQ